MITNSLEDIVRVSITVPDASECVTWTSDNTSGTINSQNSESLYNEQLSKRMGGFSLDEIESILREIYPERFV